MKPQYEPHTVQQTLGYLIEECGEVLAAAGKSLRWGLDSTNPEIEGDDDLLETNEEWLLREMVDLEGAIQRMRRMLRQREAGEGAG